MSDIECFHDPRGQNVSHRVELSESNLVEGCGEIVNILK